MLAGLILLLGTGGCNWKHQTQWAGGYLVTLYSLPPVVQPGEAQLAVRVQDRDYKMIVNRPCSLQVTAESSRQKEMIALKPGVGKDVRGWAHFPKCGKYEVEFTLADAAGPSVTARFVLSVVEEKVRR